MALRTTISAVIVLAAAALVLAQEHGPWYGHAPLSGNAREGSSIADDANRSSRPNWPYVGQWYVHGPAAGPADWRADKAAVPVAMPGKADGNSWRVATAELATGFVYLTLYHEDASRQTVPAPLVAGAAFWATTTLTAPRDAKYEFAAGVDGRLGVWIDGARVAAGPEEVDAAFEERVLQFAVTLKAGPHEIVVRCQPNANRSKFWVRVCTEKGEGEEEAAGSRHQAAGRREAAKSEAAGPDDSRPASPVASAPVGTVVGYRNDGTARYPDAHPVTAWDLERGINIRWRTPLLWSKAQPIVVGDKVFVTEEPHALVCLDKNTGRVLWRREANILELVDPNTMKRHDELKAAALAAREKVLALGSAPWLRKAKLQADGLDANAAAKRLADIEWQALDAHEQWVDFVRTAGGCQMPLVYRRAREGGPWTGYSFATPVSDGRHVWVRFGTGLTACYDLEGARRWMVRTPLVQSSGSECSSPVLVDGLLVMQFIHKQEHKIWLRIDKAWLLALDPASGREVWRTDVLDWRPNSTPVAMRLANGRDAVTVLVSGSGTVVRAADGKVLVPRMLGNDGYSSPTAQGDVVYRFGQGPSTATRLILVDRDTVGVRRLWARRTDEHSGGVVYADGLLFGLEGAERCRGFYAYEAATGRLAERRANRDIRGVGAVGWWTVWTPTTLAGEHVFLCDRGSCSNRITGDWANVSVLQARAEGRFVAHNKLEKHMDAPPFFDANCIYARTDWALTCIGPTGREGEVYEAGVNAGWLLQDIAPAPPPRRQSVVLPPAKQTPPASAVPLEPGRQRFLKDVWVGPVATASAAKAAEGLLARGGAFAEGEKLKLAGADADAYRPGKEAFPRAAILHQCVDVYDAAAMPAADAAYFACVALANERARTMRVILPGPHVRAWLAGRELADGERVTLAAGAYPLLAMVTAPRAGAAGPVFVRFEPSDDQDAEIKAWHDSVRDNRAVIERAIRLCPESDVTRKAKALLRASAATEGSRQQGAGSRQQ